MVLLVSIMTGCSAETYDSVDPNGRPNAEDIDVTITVDQETNTYKLVLNNKGYYPVWKVNVGRNPKISSTNGFTGVIAEAGTYQVEVRMGNRNGISEGSKVYDIVIEKSLGGDEFKGFKYDSEFNLWKDCTITDVAYWFADENWSQLPDPTCDIANEGFTIVLPEGMGSQQWQGQVHINTDLATNSATMYDFSIFFRSAADHPGVTVKLQNKADDNSFYCASKVALKAGEGKCFFLSGVQGIDIENIQLTLDFGGGVGGSEIQVSNIVVKDHANNDGTVLPPAVEFDESRNLFKGFKVEKITTWFANNDWSDAGITQPTINTTEDGYYFVMPDGVGPQQWQGQVHMWTNVATVAAKNYDFRAVFTSTEDHPSVTVKIQKGDSLGDSADDDNVYITVQTIQLKANVPYEFYFENLPGVDTQNIQVCCDYAGGIGGSEISVSKLALQEHL